LAHFRFQFGYSLVNGFLVQPFGFETATGTLQGALLAGDLLRLSRLDFGLPRTFLHLGQLLLHVGVVLAELLEPGQVHRFGGLRFGGSLRLLLPTLGYGLGLGLGYLRLPPFGGLGLRALRDRSTGGSLFRHLLLLVGTSDVEVDSLGHEGPLDFLKAQPP
jgi:hypothetical protein